MHPYSPRGRRIGRVEGDPDTIRRRGAEIERLGDDMIESAATLQAIADGAAGQEGLAVDRLAEIVGDVYRELRLAGEMYRPTGPVVLAYGAALADVQPRLNSRADACDELWASYARTPGFRDGERPGFAVADADSPEADAQADADRAKQAAYDAWADEAGAFDAEYDTWEAAFELAATSVGDVVDGRIEDSRWDRLDGFVAGTLEVLKWVGLALTIASIIIGGPLIGALIAVASILTLVLTIYQATRGDAGTKEVVLAAIGVIPIGHLGKGGAGIADNALGGLLTSTGRGAIRAEVSTIFGAGSGAFRTSGSTFEAIRAGFSSFARNHGTDGRMVDSIARLFTGKAVDSATTSRAGDILVGTWWTHLGRLNTGLSWGTGQGLYSRVYDGVVGADR